MTVIKIMFMGYNRIPTECIQVMYLDGYEEKEKSFKKGDKKFLKRYFNVITDHKCIIKDQYCIYTTDPLRINEHKITLRDFINAKINERIRNITQELKDLNKITDYFEKEMQYDIHS